MRTCELLKSATEVSFAGIVTFSLIELKFARVLVRPVLLKILWPYFILEIVIDRERKCIYETFYSFFISPNFNDGRVIFGHDRAIFDGPECILEGIKESFKSLYVFVEF